MEDGVWRTIRGRRVFIKKGQSLSDAMKESGKFKNKKQDIKETKNLKMKDMSEEDKKQLYEYTEGYYNYTNVALRNGENIELSKQVVELDNVIKKGYIEDGELYRTANINELGIKTDDIWDNTNNLTLKYTKDIEYGTKEYDDAVYKSYIESNKQTYNIIKNNLKINDEFEDKAFKSTSSNDEIATKYQTVYVNEKYGSVPSPTQAIIKYNIKEKINAIDIGEASYVKDQKEILLQRGTKSKITKIEFSDKYNCTYIEMDLYK